MQQIEFDFKKKISVQYIKNFIEVIRLSFGNSKNDSVI